MTKADILFQHAIEKITLEGYSDENEQVRPKWNDGTPAHTKRIFGLVNTYDLSEEFPILTIRKVPFKLCVDEILWIWQKKSNNIHDLNSHIWDQWADESGSIGKAYGYQLGVKHEYPEGEFDQVDKMLYDIQHNPASRRIMTNLYNHHDLNEMALAPCVYGTTWNVQGDKLNMLLNQRSADMITAGGWNVTQYAALLCMIAHVTNLKPGKLVHVIADAHVYDRHFELANELINSESYFKAPKLKINPDVKNFYDFTVNDLELEDYNFLEFKHKIPVAT